MRGTGVAVVVVATVPRRTRSHQALLGVGPNWTVGSARSGAGAGRAGKAWVKRQWLRLVLRRIVTASLRSANPRRGRARPKWATESEDSSFSNFNRSTRPPLHREPGNRSRRIPALPSGRPGAARALWTLHDDPHRPRAEISFPDSPFRALACSMSKRQRTRSVPGLDHRGALVAWSRAGW